MINRVCQESFRSLPSGGGRPDAWARPQVLHPSDFSSTLLFPDHRTDAEPSVSESPGRAGRGAADRVGKSTS